MLPTAEDNDVCLTDVLVSCLSAVGVSSMANRAGIPRSEAIVLVVVDGLGSMNLSRARGHARFLCDARHKVTEISSVFPSTTAAALTSLMTGVEPAQHGIVGYRIRNPATGEIFNQLNELHRAPDNWLRSVTLAAKLDGEASIHVVGREKFAHSPLTKMIYAGATYLSAESLAQRLDIAISLTQDPGQVIVVYVSELDSLAHKFGVDSAAWLAELEELDARIREATAGLPAGVSIVVTADHGVIDVPATQQTLITSPDLVDGVAGIGGEPRCLQLYVDDEEFIPRIIESWSTFVGPNADVMTRQQAFDRGLFGPHANVNPDVLARVGDVLVLAREDTVYYDGNASNRAPQRMIGQHGAQSLAEMSIPLIVIN